MITKRRIILGLLLASCGALVVLSSLSFGKAAHVAVKTPAKQHATVTPSATAAVLPSASEPASTAPTNRLQIPVLGVNAPIINIGLTKDGSVYTGGPQPGQNGTAIIDGHSGSPVQHGVLEHINRLKAGDEISIVEISGKKTKFTVTSSQAYPAVSSTAKILFDRTAGPTMNMISCYGNWDEKTQEFDQRWIVKSALAQ